MKLNLPNKLIIIRFITAFVVIGLLISIPYVDGFSYYCNITNHNVSYINVITLSLFILASFTDYLDGFLARKNNQITSFGKIFDPLADKFLVSSVLILFAIQARIPSWLIIIFIGRDLIVDGMRVFAASNNIDVSANIWGKIKTFLQMFAITILFLWFPESKNNSFDYSSLNSLFVIPMYIAALFSLISGGIYIKNFLGEIR